MNTKENSPTLDDYRNDLRFQLETPDEIDWDYFVETAKKARAEAARTGKNMVFDAQIDH